MARHLVQQPRALINIPVFLAPAFSTSVFVSGTRSFSSSSATFNRIIRGNRDKNKKRGVSAIRRTGPRYPLSVGGPESLPKPVADPSEARAAFGNSPDHGLWGFFNPEKEPLIPPAEENAHGRSWTKQELSKKGFDDLHQLYWVCLKEVNIVRTRNNERKRVRAGYGEVEGGDRIKNLRKTMSRIRHVLLARHYATFDAQLLLENKFLYELFPDLLRQHMTSADFGLEEPSESEPPSTTEESEPMLDSPALPDRSKLDPPATSAALR